MLFEKYKLIYLVAAISLDAVAEEFEVCAPTALVDYDAVNSVIDRLSVSNDVNEIFVRAQCKLTAGRVESAIADYDLLVLSTGGDPEVLKMRGIAFYNAGKYKAAMNDLVNAIHPVIPDLELPLYMGKSLIEVKDFDGAVKNLKIGIELLRDPPQAKQAWHFSRVGVDLHLALSEAYMRSNRENEAVAVLKNGLKRYADSRRLFEELMSIYLKKSNSEAIEVLLGLCSQPLIGTTIHCEAIK